MPASSPALLIQDLNGFLEMFPLMTLTSVFVRSASPKQLSLTEISELLAQKKAQEKKLKYKLFNAEESLA